MNDAGTYPIIRWNEGGNTCEARWRSLSGSMPPVRVVVVDASLTADEAHGMACQGTALLWRGDFHQARQILNAVARRADRKPRRRAAARNSADRSAPASSAGTFHLQRQARSQRARILNALLVPLGEDYSIPLPRAPDVRAACTEAFGAAKSASVIPLRALQGVIGAHEWRVKGIDIAEAGGRIHPHFGVFAPIRREYLELVATAPLPKSCESCSVAFDIGTGTGVLAAILARRGIERVIATDADERALACARENIGRLGLSARVEVIEADLFPDARASLIVCNPPWIPARPSSPLEHALYDPDSRMLRGFLSGLPAQLVPGGEGWLILSDLAEHLGLRTRGQLLEWFDSAGLEVRGRLDVTPRHPRATDETDPLHSARAAEVTSLWRLGTGRPQPLAQ